MARWYWTGGGYGHGSLAPGPNKKSRRACRLNFLLMIRSRQTIIGVVEMDGTGVPVVKKETLGRQDK